MAISHKNTYLQRIVYVLIYITKIECMLTQTERWERQRERVGERGSVKDEAV